jgi:hypothetical protein
MSSDTIVDLDAPIWGAKAIGAVAGLFKKNGKKSSGKKTSDEDDEVDLRKTFHLLEIGAIDASKAGRLWVSTPRRVRTLFLGKTA